MNASTEPTERPFAAVLSSILGNLQDIVRSEIRLVKSEAGEELTSLKYGLAWLGTGLISAFFATAFLLVAAFCGLLRVLPDWAAALALTVGLFIIAAVAVALYRGKAEAMRKVRLAARANHLQERLS